MAVKASVTITISKYRDTNSITRYYKLQASTAAAPAVPTTLTPSGWSTSEPTYTSGSTNTLYFTDRYVFSDGTFQYTEVSKSTSYEAAKEAYNKAQAAQNSATSANNKIDNLQIGGRNYILNSNFSKNTNWYAWGNPTTREIIKDGKKNWAHIVSTGTSRYQGYAQNAYINNNIILDGDGKYTFSAKVKGGTAGQVFTVGFHWFAPGSTEIISQSWKHFTIGKEVTTVVMTMDVIGKEHFNIMLGVDSPTNIYDVYFTDIKFEKGVINTAWTPAPEDMDDAIKSVVNLYYSSNSSTLPAKPTAHVTTNNTTTYNAWNIGLPTYNEQYPYLYTCKEVLNKGGTYSWTTVNQTTYSEAIKTIQTELDAVQADYLKESTFATYKREQIKNDQGIEQRLSKTEVTVYGDPENPDDPKALINHIQKVDNDINGSGGLDDRLGAAEGTIEGTGLNEYDQRVKITQRFLNVETDVESIKNIFNITGGTNLIQNSVGYFASNNKPSMWDIASNTIYTPFGYDGDLTGVTVSRGKLFCAKGSITTTTNNIIALLSNKIVSISFKYKNGANATSKIKIFNGSIIYFEKAFNTTVNQWTEYKFNPDTDPILANPTFLNISNSLQISIESTNSTDNNGFEISDLMLNYGNVKPWELYSNEVYGAMVKLSSLGIEVTATTANTKNFMTTDGILVYRYDSKTDKIIGTDPITKITDNGTITNKLESTGDIIERNLIQTVIKDSSNKDIYVEYIR